ncbi:hypothetical protein N7495_003849 [Penicillium taxi]|uniref:uncharacterized protein n=1 Tax=Penicillium taxi TaxID=168475 RepID=UPI0025459D93|nr:uncharacterized protein N7495_003849 [Penicillium taxi]KAJ5899105.1 hypothetical protein N7495_003849 [Penicillium taxi]
MPSPISIAIIGGGPAGLTAGVLLQKHGIQFTIFDLRQKPTDEELAQPSGVLDLHEEAGLAALREAGLYDEFLQFTGECSEAQKVSDKDGNILWSDEGGLAERPEISRHALTSLLSSHIPSENIKWGHKLLSWTEVTVTSERGHKFELDFGSQGRHIFDLVIGADGAWSKVRNMLTSVKPHYAGIQCITMTIRQITAKYPHLAEMIGLGSFVALGHGHGVMTQRASQDSARIYIMLSIKDENFPTVSGLADGPPSAAEDRLLNDLELLGLWGPLLKDLVVVACDEDTSDRPNANLDIRPLYTLPIGSSWERLSGVTLIGDAAHLMTPWAGEGVNMAMLDALELVHVITKAHDASSTTTTATLALLDPLMEQFEKNMVARAKVKAEETAKNGEMMFGEDAAQAFAKFFISAFGAAEAK